MVYPLYKGCLFALEAESASAVTLIINMAKNMISEGLQEGKNRAALIVCYREQLDWLVANVPLHIRPKRIVPGTVEQEVSMAWCLKVIALEVLKALPRDEKNGTTIVACDHCEQV